MDDDLNPAFAESDSENDHTKKDGDNNKVSYKVNFIILIAVIVFTAIIALVYKIFA